MIHVEVMMEAGARGTALNRLPGFDSLRKGAGIRHARFGDLANPGAVIMPRFSRTAFSHVERDDIIVHLTVTGRCNARCEGCVNTALTMGCARGEFADQFEASPERDAAVVGRIAALHPVRPLLVALYGGEPLLEAERLSDIMRALQEGPAGGRTRFMIYTNGQLLGRAVNEHPSILEGATLVSVSIDGKPEQHARVRPGTDIPSIVSGLEELRQHYRGEVLFWSTLREEQSLMSCFQQFMELYRRGLVTQMFWHWADAPQPFRDFPAYVRTFGPELEAVVEEYVRALRGGVLLPVAHLNELVLYLLEGRMRGHSACAVERAENFDIVGGRLSACADLPPGVGAVEVDAFGNGCMPDLGYLVGYRHDLGCDVCGVDAYCGGRCPVQVLAGSPERTLQVCQLMRLYVGTVAERIDEISELLRLASLQPQDIYDRSAYVTRYTDVVP